MVAKLLDEEVLPQIEEIVVGYPLRDDGSDTDASEGIKSFVGRLQKTFEGMPIKLVDESFSSKRAKEEIVKAGVPKMKRRNKGLLDQVSATLILQDYLDNR